MIVLSGPDSPGELSPASEPLRAAPEELFGSSNPETAGSVPQRRPVSPRTSMLAPGGPTARPAALTVSHLNN